LDVWHHFFSDGQVVIAGRREVNAVSDTITKCDPKGYVLLALLLLLNGNFDAGPVTDAL